MDLLRFDHVTEEGRVVLCDDNGTNFELEVDAALRGAVRGTTSLTARMVSERNGELRPRDLQTLIRSGATPEEVADASGLDIDHVRRYAGPILDEREFITKQACQLPVSHIDGTPTLEELAVDRLAARGVNPDEIAWDAVREAGRWVLSAFFTTAQSAHEARWTVDLAGRTLTPLDDEARWISLVEKDNPLAASSQSERPEPVLIAVPDPADQGPEQPSARLNAPEYASPTPKAAQDPGPEQATVTLLDELFAARGLRSPEADDNFLFNQTLEQDPADDDFNAEILDLPLGSHPADAFLMPPYPSASPDYGSSEGYKAPPADAGDSSPSADLPSVLPDKPFKHAGPEPAENDPDAASSKPDTPTNRRGRSGRASMPRWDEIVFGARPGHDD